MSPLGVISRSCRAASRPRPVFARVTRTVLPVRSMVVDGSDVYYALTKSRIVYVRPIVELEMAVLGALGTFLYPPLRKVKTEVLSYAVNVHDATKERQKEHHSDDRGLMSKRSR